MHGGLWDILAQMFCSKSPDFFLQIMQNINFCICDRLYDEFVVNLAKGIYMAQVLEGVKNFPNVLVYKICT